MSSIVSGLCDIWKNFASLTHFQREFSVFFLHKIHQQQHIQHDNPNDAVEQHPRLYHQFEYPHELTSLSVLLRHKNLCLVLMETQCLCCSAKHSIVLNHSHLPHFIRKNKNKNVILLKKMHILPIMATSIGFTEAV